MPSHRETQLHAQLWRSNWIQIKSWWNWCKHMGIRLIIQSIIFNINLYTIKHLYTIKNASKEYRLDILSICPRDPYDFQEDSQSDDEESDVNKKKTKPQVTIFLLAAVLVRHQNFWIASFYTELFNMLSNLKYSRLFLPSFSGNKNSSYWNRSWNFSIC